MIDRRIGKVKLRRGTDLQRKSMIFEEGEIIYATDTKRTFIGDGITKGGIQISNRNYVVNQYGIPSNGMYGDIIHVQPTKKTYIIGHDLDGVTLKLYLIADASISDDLNTKLDELKTKFANLSACLTAPKPKPTVPTTPTVNLVWAIHPISQSAMIADTIEFKALATGPYPDIVYTWEEIDAFGNYVLIPAAIGNTYTIYDVQKNDGTYNRCVATSKAGTIYSKPALLTVEASDYLMTEDCDLIITENDEFIETFVGSVAPVILLSVDNCIGLMTENGDYIEVI